MTATVFPTKRTLTPTTPPSPPKCRRRLPHNAARSWTFNEYRNYSGGVDFVDWERNRVNAPGASASGFQALGAQGTPSFTAIIDGDLDGDGSPNFLDPDNDNDGTPDSADTDDDNDGILDMVDPDDDNDGIPDTCIEIDTNGDQASDYTGLQNGGAERHPHRRRQQLRRRQQRRHLLFHQQRLRPHARHHHQRCVVTSVSINRPDPDILQATS